jgi:hypothetical protein
MDEGYPAQVPKPINTRAATSHQILGEKKAIKLAAPTKEVPIKYNSLGPNISISFPTTGCPIAVVRYKAETSQAVCDG